MRLRHLRWLTALFVLLVLVAAHLLRLPACPEPLQGWSGSLLALSMLGVGALLGVRAIFVPVEAAERRLAEQDAALEQAGVVIRRQATHLRALHQSGLALASEHDLGALLQRVVDLARELVGARYGALGVFDADGRMLRFLTSGITAAERAGVGDPPQGRGLLGAVLTEGRPVRVDDISRDPRSVGFPAGHPEMTTFLGVPLVARGRTFGNLYVTDKLRSGVPVPFTEADEELLQLFAAQAAVAIENAQLLAELQGLAATVERERIARELHDSLAQVLGYVRLRAVTGSDALASGEVATTQRALEDIITATGEAYADVREAILGLRSHIGNGRDLWGALREYLERYRQQSRLEVEMVLGEEVGETRVSPEAEVQLLRIIQEALTNVRKHASARRASVRFERAVDATGPWLRAVVADDGRGFDPQRVARGTQFGLATMRERAEAAGGRLRIESTPGQGTTVIVEFPLGTPTTAAATAQRGAA